jgi:hypothetical protein
LDIRKGNLKLYEKRSSKISGIRRRPVPVTIRLDLRLFLPFRTLFHCGWYDFYGKKWFPGERIHEWFMDASGQILVSTMGAGMCPNRFAAGFLNMKRKGCNSRERFEAFAAFLFSSPFSHGLKAE